MNGNGRPVLPPGALSPITIYRQPEPPPRSGWATLRTIFAWSFVALLVVLGSIGGGAYLWFQESVAAVVASTPDVKVAAKRLDVALPGQPATALVVGYDQRAGEDAGVQSRSDTVMLVRADHDVRRIEIRVRIEAIRIRRGITVKVFNRVALVIEIGRFGAVADVGHEVSVGRHGIAEFV